ncbi:MAG: redox-sensing transcriptional repressor Rex [Peptococcaceae bacterium]|jgi:redox-sensing transcriptional repressor|nr:redox-sensing transcriptional repressor Rex [Peptococcaceae bacterium]
MGNSPKDNAQNIVKISRPTLRRLPLYYQYLKREQALGREFISCTSIAEGMGLTSIQVRKDLQVTGAVGKPKVGYHIGAAITSIEESLGYNNTKDALLVGAGHLGLALLGYEGFADYGLNIVAAFDKDPAKIGTQYRGKNVLDIAKFPDLAKRLNVQIGIITVPSAQAMDVCNLMIESGIRAIWNFAPVHLVVPEDVIIQNENMAASLSILSQELLKVKQK